MTIQKISLQDKNYPKLLRQIYKPPKELYVMGDLMPKETNALAVVGTRLYSAYGKSICQTLVQELSGYNFTIISGLAIGIDIFAHLAALENGLKTIAVLGSGFHYIYPSAHKKIAERIVRSGGALVSEYPPDTRPDRWQFPARNRIIAGLAQATLVVEAPIKSGALITAHYALDEGREVMAVPGDLNKKNSEGTNYLIHEGAKMIQSSQDIIEAYGLKSKEKSSAPLPLNQEEKLLLKIIEREPLHIDKIIDLSKLDSSAVISTLTVMEINKKVKNLGNGSYAIF